MTELVNATATRGYVCRYCRLGSDGSEPVCPSCGAPADVTAIRDDEGWVEQPPVHDMARIQFGRSRCQITGTSVPVAQMDLAADDQIYFSHHVLLWTDPGTQLTVRPMPSAWARKKAGMPLVMLDAAGPGHIALSEDDAGEIVVVPLEAGRSVDVMEGHFLMASAAVTYSLRYTEVWWSIGTGNHAESHFPLGRYMDRFSAEQRGLLLLHASGNTFIRDLREDERIYLAPRALVYKDASVHMNIHMERPASPKKHWQLSQLVRLTGPGRVAIQSQYGGEELPHWGWTGLDPDGSWRNHNADPHTATWSIKDREP
jgi:uncharacterized protein (AIM24 family)